MAGACRKFYRKSEILVYNGVMKIFLNGEEVKLESALSMSSLLEKYLLDKRKIAVERNFEIVPHSSFSEVVIEEGDRIEIIHFIGGG